MILLAETASGDLPVGTILMGLFGGLALFLFGMDQMADALKLVAGTGMKNILAKLTTNRFTGAVAGALVTAVIQSSSVTTVLVVGFVSAGMMTLSQSIGVIMGANIGTTVTAQIIAFKITDIGLLLAAIGFFITFCFKNKTIKQYGQMLMGLGLIFFGMQLMSDGTKPLRSFQPFIDMMQRMDNPLMGILLGATFTAMVQSSSATTGLVIVLAGQGLISLEAGVALIFGANVGTCVTAMLASIGKTREALRSALVHLIFNGAGVLLWIPVIPQLAALATWFTPSGSDLIASAPRQIANAHTVFNVTNTLIFIWFTNPLAWLVCRLVKEQPKSEPQVAQPQYLNEYILETPAVALDFVRLELVRLGQAVLQMARRALETVIHGSPADLDRLEQMDDDVDALHGAVVTFLGRLSQESLTDKQSDQLHDCLAAANCIEGIGDMIETNLVEVGRERSRAQVRISESTQGLLHALNRQVIWSVQRALQAWGEDDQEAAREVVAAKADVNHLTRSAEEHLSRRLGANEPNRLVLFQLESEIMEYLHRMYYFSKRIAKLVDQDDSNSVNEQPEQLTQSASTE